MVNRVMHPVKTVINLLGRPGTALCWISASQVVLGAAIATAQPTERWIHSTYSNGVTTLAIAETTEKDQFDSVYETVVNGKPLRGVLNITSIRRDQRYTYLTGQFSDSCTGRISIRRSHPQPGKPIMAEVTWIVTQEPVQFMMQARQQTCQVPKGQKIQLNLPEALPRADQRGNFTNANSNTFLFEQGNFAWTQWQVVAADGVLNCRDQPNGKVKLTYRRGQIISKLGREMLSGGNLVELPDGSSWLKTKDRCMVRASDRWIKPVSLPRKFW